MPLLKPYINIPCCLQSIVCKARRGLMLALLLFMLPCLVMASGEAGVTGKSGPSGTSGNSGKNENTGKADKYGEADKYAESEILITLNVPRVGVVELPAIIFGQDVYLPVKDLFDFLKIKNNLSDNLDSCTGFFINPGAPFLIDNAQSEIHFQNQVIKLNYDDIVQTETGLFLKIQFFSEVFGLDCNFHFRSLSITLTTKIELPAVREMQMALMHRNISKLKGERKADTTFKRSFPLLKIGVADWLVYSSQTKDRQPTTQFNLGLGGIILGGEASVNLNYVTGKPFMKNQQYYNWRYVNNNHRLVKQVMAGKIFTQANASVFAPVNGIQFTNTPTTYRRSFGTYTLTDKTEPGWTVELFVNNVLVNYTKADASGFFTFEVPMVYGNSIVKLRYFGPWGEERTSERNINIPFNFVPVNQLEYTITAGVIADDTKARFARANFNYGVNKIMTVSGGVEYLSSVSSGKVLPYLNTSVRVHSNVLFAAERILGVRTKSNINYRTKSNIQLDLNYTKYDEAQTAIKFNYLEETKAVLSIPLKSKNFTAFSRLSVSQIRLAKTKNTLAEMLISAQVLGINTNITTFAIISNPTDRLIFSNMSLNFRLPHGIRINPQVQYEYRQKAISMYRIEMEKRIMRQAFVTMFYDRNKNTNIQMFGLGFRYNFKAAQTTSMVTNSNQGISAFQIARGSMIFDGKSGDVFVNNQSNMGKGGIVVTAFLDMNNNGKQDEGETRLEGLNLKVNGGKLIHNEKDTSIRILNLEPFANYYVDLDNNSFDNVAWKLKFNSFNVAIDANHLKHILVPVTVGGEVSGYVNLTSFEKVKGIARLIVNIYDTRGNLVAKTLAESDGYFSYLGLQPGNYIASVDAGQLNNLHMITLNEEIEFTIKASRDGDMVGGLLFDLRHVER